MLDPTPNPTYPTDLCNALTELGLDVVFVTSRDYQHASRARFRVRAVAPPSVRGRYLTKAADECRYVALAAKLVHQWRPDVVHIQFPRARIEILALAALRLTRTPVVWTAHNVMPHDPRRLDWLYYRATYRLVDGLIVHTNQARDLLLHRFPIWPEVVSVIPHGNYESLPHRLLPAEEARARLEVPADAIVLLFYGILRPYKGYDELLEAFVMASERASHAVLIIAGRAFSTEAQQLTSRVASLPRRIRDRIRLHVPTHCYLDQDVTDQLFSAADVVTLPYREITQSGVLFQAFSYGRPVLASAVGGFAETVIEGVNGYLFRQGDLQNLADRIVELSQDRQRLVECGNRARERARSENDYTRIAALTRDVYQIAIGARR